MPSVPDAQHGRMHHRPCPLRSVELIPTTPSAFSGGAPDTGAYAATVGRHPPECGEGQPGQRRPKLRWRIGLPSEGVPSRVHVRAAVVRRSSRASTWVGTTNFRVRSAARQRLSEDARPDHHAIGHNRRGPPSKGLHERTDEKGVASHPPRTGCAPGAGGECARSRTDDPGLARARPGSSNRYAVSRGRAA